MSMQSKMKRATKAAGKWWRKQPSSGKHQNRKIYAKVGHVNPHAHTGPSLLLQALFVGMGREYMQQVQLRKAA
jgi:hypothetical protein